MVHEHSRLAKRVFVNPYSGNLFLVLSNGTQVSVAAKLFPSEYGHDDFTTTETVT